MAETRQVDSGKAVGYGWESVKKDLWYFVGLALMVAIIGGLGNEIDDKLGGWSLVSLLLSTWMTCGYLKMTLSYQAGNKLPFEELFKQFKYYWRILGATLLLGLIIGIGFVLLIIPGIYLALRYQFTILLIVDKDMGITQAMDESSKMTEGIKMQLFGFALVCLGVMILGAIALGVGVLVAIPVIWLAQVYIYKTLQQPVAEAQS